MRFLSAPFIFPIHIKPISNGIVIIDDNGKIHDVLDPAINEIPSLLPIEKLDGILCPGFVNAHCHLELSHLKRKFTQKKGLPFFIDEMVKADRSDNDVSRIAMNDADREMFEKGIVAVGDISNTSVSIEIKNKSKIFYHTFIELFDISPDYAENVFAKGLVLQKEFNEAGLISSVVPHSSYTVSGKLMGLISKESEKTGNIICIHNQETASEDEMFEKGTGVLLEKLNKITNAFKSWNPSGQSSLKSILEKFNSDQPLQLVHNTFTKKNDVENANQKMKNVFWCLCVNANLFIENIHPDIEMLMKEKCVMTIGTDSYASNMSLSILDELKTISLKFPGIKLEEMLRWATINGATFLRIDDNFGTLEKGKSPGINLVTNIEPQALKLKKESRVKRVV